MKHQIEFLFALFYLFTLSPIFSQTIDSQPIKSKLEAINRQLSNDFKQKNIDNILSHFQEDAWFMPEFQPMSQGTDAIKAYYQEILKRWDIKVFDKKIIEILNLKDNIVEIGTFTMSYKANNQDFTLNGKYLNNWAMSQDGVLKKKAETYGYFHKVENANAHLVNITREFIPKARLLQTQKDKNIAFELKALNALNMQTVKKRDGDGSADFFAKDGIFIPFADTMKVGESAIRKHLVAYNKNPINIDSIEVYTIDFEDCDAYIIEYYKFFVRAHIGYYAGITSGKGIRIWRREPNGTLKRYRETGAHDVK